MKKSIPYISYKLYRKILAIKNDSKNQLVLTWSRSSTIIPLMIGCTIGVYNGKKHVPILISEQLVGYKLGEFVPTRTFKSHKKISKKIKKQ